MLHSIANLDEVVVDEAVRTHLVDQEFVECALEYLKQQNRANIKYVVEREDRKIDKFIATAQKCQTLDELRVLLEKSSMMWKCEIGFRQHTRVNSLLLYHEITIKEISRGTIPWMEALTIQSAVEEDEIDSIKEILSTEATKWKGKIWARTGSSLLDVGNSDSDSVSNGDTDWEFSSEIYSALYSILMSDKVYSGNVAAPDAVVSQINKIAKIDRLPTENTATALRIIRTCWDCVDVFNELANKQKHVTKTCYALLLLVGYLTTCFTTIYANGVIHPNQEVITAKQLEGIVISLSLVASIIASYVTYSNPAKKWQTLRGAALAIESEVWTFRTRTGPYALSTDSSKYNKRAGEDHLRQFTTLINKNVIKSAAVAETSFESSFSFLTNPSKAKKLNHGQHRGAGTKGSFGGPIGGIGTLNDHYSPINPDMYLELRVKPMMAFYYSRLPIYHRARSVAEAFTVLAALSGALLAFAHAAIWTPVLAAAAAMLSAWMEFSGTSKKMSRYNDGMVQVRQIQFWWDSMTEVDKASLTNIGELVQSCEDLFTSEHQSWLSTSMVTKMLAKATDSGGAEDAV